MKETMLIQNKRLDKLTTIENKLDGILFIVCLLISAARPTRHGELTHKTKYDTCLTSTH